MASRKKEKTPAVQELIRLQNIGAEEMERNFNAWVLDNHSFVVDLVLARAADERETVADAAYGIFLDCLRTHQHQMQVNLAADIERKARAEENEAA